MAFLPPVILASIALDEVITALAGGTARTEAEKFELSKEATKRLQTACAAGLLTMVTIDPRSADRHAVPAEYFDDRPMAELEFVSGLFRAAELSEQVVVDPLYRAVLPYRGWAHGFIEPVFRAWLQSENAGGNASTTVGAEAPQRRCHYVGALAQFLASKKNVFWERTSNAEIEKQFRGWYGERQPPLPHPRYVTTQIRSRRTAPHAGSNR